MTGFEPATLNLVRWWISSGWSAPVPRRSLPSPQSYEHEPARIFRDQPALEVQTFCLSLDQQDRTQLLFSRATSSEFGKASDSLPARRPSTGSNQACLVTDDRPTADRVNRCRRNASGTSLSQGSRAFRWCSLPLLRTSGISAHPLLTEKVAAERLGLGWQRPFIEPRDADVSASWNIGQPEIGYGMGGR
jgi:hypothetical protein